MSVFVKYGTGIIKTDISCYGATNCSVGSDYNPTLGNQKKLAVLCKQKQSCSTKR